MLRPYQKRICTEIGTQSSIVVLPTGTGKTFIATEIIKQFYSREHSAPRALTDAKIDISTYSTENVVSFIRRADPQPVQAKDIAAFFHMDKHAVNVGNDQVNGLYKLMELGVLKKIEAWPGAWWELGDRETRAVVYVSYSSKKRERDEETHDIGTVSGIKEKLKLVHASSIQTHAASGPLASSALSADSAMRISGNVWLHVLIHMLLAVTSTDFFRNDIQLAF